MQDEGYISLRRDVQRLGDEAEGPKVLWGQL